MFNLSRMNRFWPLPKQITKGKSLVKEVENSIPLRVLVMVLVILGIVSTDIAGETKFSLWTIPLTMVGTWWSYYRRRSSNIPDRKSVV